MFSKLALFAVAAMATFVAALPRPGGESGTDYSCNTGPIQCCDSLQSTNSQAVQTNKALIGAIIPADVLAGINCTPISILALTGQSCTAQTVCCSNNSFNGVVALGCTPININA